MQVSPAEIRRQKAELRRVAVATRAQAAAAAPADAADRIAAIALERLRDRTPAIVSGFWPIRSEVDVRPLLRSLAGQGWVAALPAVVTRGHPLAFRRWDLGEPAALDVCGIPVPAPETETVIPDVILVPLLAFDARGFRLGYGGGYYDRTLASLRPQRQVMAVGVAYAAQARSDIPLHDGDQPVDAILTERGWAWSATGEETR